MKKATILCFLIGFILLIGGIAIWLGTLVWSN